MVYTLESVPSGGQRRELQVRSIYHFREHLLIKVTFTKK